MGKTSFTIADCFSFIRNGANIKQDKEKRGYPITRIETTSNSIFNRDKVGYAGIEDITPYQDYVLEDGDLLMSHINSLPYLGRVVYYDRKQNEVIIHGMHLLRLKAIRTRLRPRYATFLFSAIRFKNKIYAIAKKSVNQASFSINDLKKISIELPTVELQDHIVNKLVGIQKIIKLRQAQLAKLDELVKCRFVEMEAKWKKCTTKGLLKSFLHDITYGFTNPMPDSTNGPWKITAKDIVGGLINFKTARKTDILSYNALTAKSKPAIGDVLLTKDGTLGRTAIVTTDNICVNQSVAVLKCNERLLPEFLSLLLQLPYYQEEMLKNAGGGTIKHIYITRIVDMIVTIPDIATQREFITFVRRVDKLRFVDHIGGVQFIQSLIPDLFLSASFLELLNHLLVIVFGRRMQIE